MYIVSHISYIMYYILSSTHKYNIYYSICRGGLLRCHTQACPQLGHGSGQDPPSLATGRAWPAI